MVKVTVNDNRTEYPLKDTTIKYCQTLRNIVEDCGDQADTIPLTPPAQVEVNEEVLNLVEQFAEYVASDQFPRDTRGEEGEKRIESKELTEFETKFFEELDNQMIRNLMLLTNFLEFKAMLQVCLLKSSFIIKDLLKNPNKEQGLKDVREFLQEPDDLNDAQKAEILRQQNELDFDQKKVEDLASQSSTGGAQSADGTTPSGEPDD